MMIIQNLHIHVIYGDDQAKVAINSKRIIAGKMPKNAYRLIKQWLNLNENDVMAAWTDAMNGIEPRKVEPLR